MAYDKSKDVVLKELEPCQAIADEEFHFKVVRYNGGEIKLSITKTYWYEPTKEFRETTKLGRLTLQNMLDISSRIDQAVEFIQGTNEFENLKEE